MDPQDLTLTRIHEGLQKKLFSCRELVHTYQQRIEQCEPALNAFIFRNTDAALERADAVDAKITHNETLGTLEGQPLAIKDTILVKGMRATAASAMLREYVAPYDAAVMEQLHGAGALTLGKTNCDEFAMGASGEHSAFGPTKNPWDTSRVPGGSSSGSAAAVAAGEAVAALGSDTGGSIRQPAAFCGLVGLKPTYGRVSRYGLIALASSLDQIGPITRTVEDSAILLNAIAGKDPRDATSVDQPAVDLEAIRAGSLRGMNIGVPKEYFLGGMDADVERIVRDTITLLQQNGATIVEVSLPHTDDALAVYYLLLPAEASTNLARYDGIRYGLSKSGDDLIAGYFASREAGFGAEVKRRIMLGTYALSAGYHDKYYGQAQRVRTLIRHDFTDVFKNVDALIAPTTPTTAFKLGEKFDDPLTMYLADIFTVAANIAGIPALSVPAGRNGTLPVGVQLLGPLWSEERLLTIAQNIEQTLALPLQIPQIKVP